MVPAECERPGFNASNFVDDSRRNFRGWHPTIGASESIDIVLVTIVEIGRREAKWRASHPAAHTIATRNYAGVAHMIGAPLTPGRVVQAPRAIEAIDTW